MRTRLLCGAKKPCFSLRCNTHFQSRRSPHSGISRSSRCRRRGAPRNAGRRRSRSSFRARRRKMPPGFSSPRSKTRAGIDGSSARGVGASAKMKSNCCRQLFMNRKTSPRMSTLSVTASFCMHCRMKAAWNRGRPLCSPPACILATAFLARCFRAGEEVEGCGSVEVDVAVYHVEDVLLGKSQLWVLPLNVRAARRSAVPCIVLLIILIVWC